MSEFEELYERYFRDVYRFTLSLCRSQNTAEELTQAAFFHALEHIGSFRGDCDVKVWLFQIAKNAWLTECRKQKRFSDEEPPEGLGGAPEETLLRGEDTYRLYAALHRVEEPYKEVFSLRVFGELSFRQIGQIFGKTENWARVTYHRAKIKVKERVL